MSIHLNLFLTTTISACLALSNTANATSYTAIDLNYPSDTSSRGVAINDSGHVVGSVFSDQYVANRGFLYGADDQFGANGDGTKILGHLDGSAYGYYNNSNYGVSSYARGINASGRVVGESYFNNIVPVSHAYITDTNGRMMTDLGTLGGFNSAAYGINASGQVVGYAFLAGNQAAHAFITSANGVSMTDLGTLGGSFSAAVGINAGGQVVGYSSIAGDSILHSFITGSNGMGLTDLGNLDASAINDSGQVVGTSNGHAFITDAYGMDLTDLGTLGGSSSIANGINARGQVVGSSYTSGNVQHAFVTGDNGEDMIDLSLLVTLDGGDYIYNATGVNDLGQIVANSIFGRAYLLTESEISAVPLPNSWALLLSGFGMIGIMARRRKGQTG